MNVRKTVKKIVALGTGATMVGATILGAAAYDLADYPSPFIADGVFDGSIVVGERAEAQDILGSIDIAASLQALSVSKQAIQVPGQSGQVSLEGDAYKLESSSDRLELREEIGNVVDTIMESNLAGLKSGHISTSEGETDYQQYLRFVDGTNLQDMGVNFVENDDNEMDDFLVIEADKPFMEWEIQFPEGLESSRVTTTDTTTGTDLEDLDDKSFNILGTDFTIVDADVSATGTSFSMTLMGGSLSDTLREGETKTYTLEGVEYEVTLIFVSDPQSTGGSVEAKFMVNGEVTPAMGEGDTETVSGGIQIGVRDILANARDGLASFFLGANKVELTDANTSTTTTFEGNIKINNENINDGDVEVQGQFTDSTNTVYEITSIKYRLTMKADSGSVAYIPAGAGVKEFMDKPESLISDSLDLRYEGIEEVETAEFRVDSKGDDEYELTFTNILGQTYENVPYVSYEGGTWKFGSADDELIFVEAKNSTPWSGAAAPSAGVIGRQDYFIVSDARVAADKDKSVTNVLRYEDYDSSSRTLEFEDLATGGTVVVTVSTTGTGNLIVGGNTYAVTVNQTTHRTPLITVDLDGDSAYNDKVTITSWGGAYVDIANLVEQNATTNGDLSSVAHLQTMVGNGLDIEDGANWVEATGRRVVSLLTVDDSRFDTTGTDETMNWSVQTAANNEVDLSFGSSSVTGPHITAGSEYSKFEFTTMAGDDDHQIGMTDYGIYIDEYNPSGSSTPNELVLEIPEMQRLAQVFVTLGSVEVVEGGSGATTDVVNPISVGLAVLDSDAPAIGTENMIVVGGPCVNTVAAELMGNPADCTAGFTAGKAMIKSYEENGNVAILVAGMNAEDTVGASYVLSNYDDYAAFQGEEVEVVVPDLSNIVVQAVTPTMEDDMDDDAEDMGDDMDDA